MLSKTFVRNTALLLILEALLIFVPLIVLGAAIDWPNILDQPANVVLTTIFQQADATRLGYFVYLIYSILFFPVALLTAHIVADDKPMGATLQIAVGFSVISTLARSIGIIRWLVATPALAAAYNAPNVLPETQATLGIVYHVLNDFGGSIGEILGVSLFAAIWMLLLSLMILRMNTLPRWLGVFGVITAISLVAPALEIFGIDIGPIIIASVAVIQLWFLAAGVTLLFRGSGSTQTVAVAQA